MPLPESHILKIIQRVSNPSYPKELACKIH